MSEAAATDRPLVGPKDSRYELLVKLASGGMGTVYIGRRRTEQGFSRLVAIKRAHPHLLEQEGIRRMFLEEAKISSGIQHAHVVSVHDVEEIDDEIFLVMEYVEGSSLSRLAPEGQPIPAPIGVRMILDAASGLQAAHSLTDEHGSHLQLVHRDVSPHNLLISVRDGMTRVSDFGIAKIASPTSALTRTGVIRGKSGYLSPEYALGHGCDARSDVFALGIVAWETLVGRRLFVGSGELDVLQRICNEDAPLASMFREDLSVFDEVLAKALARDPEHRFRSALDFGTALEHVARTHGLLASHAEVAAFVSQRLGPAIEARRKEVASLSGGGKKSFVSATSASEAKTKTAATVTFDATTPDAGQPILGATLDDHATGTAMSRETKIPLHSRRAFQTGAIAVGIVAALGAGISMRAKKEAISAPSATGSVEATTTVTAPTAANVLVSEPTPSAITTATPPSARTVAPTHAVVPARVRPSVVPLSSAKTPSGKGIPRNPYD